MEEEIKKRNEKRAEYLKSIQYYCLVMSNKYIRNHFGDIKKYASVVENRMDDEYQIDIEL